MTARERAEQTVAATLRFETDNSEEVASDVLDDLGSAGFTVLETWQVDAHAHADAARRACLLARQTLELFHAHGPLGSLTWTAEIGSQELTDALNRLAAIEREVQP